MAHRRKVKPEPTDEIPTLRPRRSIAPPEYEPVVEIIDDVDQNSEEWFELRLGMVTASNFGKVLATGDGKTRKQLQRQLVGELVTRVPHEGFKNAAMQRGHDMEDDIRNSYCLDRAVEVERVGFVRRTIRPGFVVGCSPDSLITRTQTVVEIKSMQPDLLVELWETGRFPTEHRAQCQGALWVTGWSKLDLVIGYRGWPKPFIFSVERDDAYIAELERAVEVFDYEVRKRADEIKKWGAI